LEWDEKTHDHVQISREQSILEDASIRNIDPLTFIGDNDDSSTKGDVASKVNISGNRQVVKLENLGDLLEPLLELLDLFRRSKIKN